MGTRFCVIRTEAVAPAEQRADPRWLSIVETIEFLPAEEPAPVDD